uniref:thioredoxin-dependent peroxiredoxin n=1 Tax=Xiphophorus couchianus TaxID=32473 RepID=A0A3B5KXJ2_9TELE
MVIRMYSTHGIGLGHMATNLLTQRPFPGFFAEEGTSKKICLMFWINNILCNAKIGKLAPDFLAKAVMPDGQFKDLKLSDYRGKYVVFFFYPLDFTFVCPTEIIAFSDAAEDFRKIGCEVIAASVDSHFSHFAWTNTPRKQGGLGAMKIPLVSDTRRTISTDYGVLKDDEGIAYRGLFIIDDKGVLRQITINDLPVGRSVEETLRLVQAFQFTDKHGEVCPAGWKPGSDTIKPDVQKSKDFFSKQQ